MDNFDKKKWVVVDLPDPLQNMIYTPFISMVGMTTKTQITLQKNAFNKKNNSGHAEYFLHTI